MTDEDVGRNVRACRELTGQSQAEVAAAMTQAGHSWVAQTVLKVEKGTRALKLNEATDLAAVLSVTLDELVGGPRRSPADAALIAALRTYSDAERAATAAVRALRDAEASTRAAMQETSALSRDYLDLGRAMVAHYPAATVAVRALAEHEAATDGE